MAGLHAQDSRLHNGLAPDSTQARGEWDGLASLDGPIALPDMISPGTKEGQRGGATHTLGLLAAVKFLWLTKPGGSRGASVAWRSVRVGLRNKLSAGARGFGRYLHVSRSTQGNIQKSRGRLLPRFSTLMEDTYECVACLSNIAVSVEEAIQVSCGHLYHAECLLQLVEVAMRSPAQFPPRCCKRPVHLSSFEHLLDAREKDAYTMREMEQATARRVYCSSPRCSRFLGPRVKQIPVQIYTCPITSCNMRTCARCKAAVGPSTTPETHQCVHDPGHRAALQLGSRLGWVRCPDCEHLVERDSGCAHMRCICGAQFCYSCGAKWKTCSCVEWRCPAGDLELPPRGGGRMRERDLFAPLQEDGDIGGRLELWAPPTLLPGERLAAWPTHPDAEMHGEGSTRHRTPTLPQPMRGELRGDVQTTRASSRGTASLRSSMVTVEEDPLEGQIGSCLPFRPNVYVPSGGGTSADVRRRLVRGISA
ncbi:hypothetical protein BV20DRAFT_191557 [Pilatotrama ljubarskyi]|nr:hypothetical protein BV20DRAFT_191557 [Pilatotrama ljubarskyi]